jgi:hypothetical protein
VAVKPLVANFLPRQTGPWPRGRKVGEFKGDVLLTAIGHERKLVDVSVVHPQRSTTGKPTAGGRAAAHRDKEKVTKCGKRFLFPDSKNMRLVSASVESLGALGQPLMSLVGWLAGLAAPLDMVNDR